MSRGGFFAVDSLTSVHVIVVDDEEPFRGILMSLLRYCGALVTAVATADDALASMDQVKPDVVVVTSRGARGPADRLVSLIRSRKPENGGVVPIVAVLREGVETPVDGVNAHIAEPLNPWELCRLISGLLATD